MMKTLVSEKKPLLQQIRHKFFKKKTFKNAYSLFEEDNNILLLAEAFYKIFKAQLGKERLTTAYTDPRLYRLADLFLDIGYIIESVEYAYFEQENEETKTQTSHIRPIADLDPSKFDVIFGVAGINLFNFALTVKQALSNIQMKNFRTCLNLHKISILAVAAYFLPDNATIVEVGSYKCGTTIFLAELCRMLNKQIKIYACDTFKGMPAATDPDYLDRCVYDTGLFADNPIEEIQAKILSQGLENIIQLVQGDVHQTLPNLNLSEVHLMFLDTDQYKGTKVGLDMVQTLNNQPMIVIDDSTLAGVSLAIDQFIENQKSYRRKNVYHNFDLLISQ